MSTLRGFGLLGFPNLIAKPYCSVDVPFPGFVPEEMGPEWMKTSEPSDRSRILTTAPLATIWNFSFTAGAQRRIDGIAVVNSNISRFGMYRFMLGVPTYEDSQASSIQSSTNSTGSLINLSDDPTQPDGSVIGPVDGSLPWSIVLRFPAPLTSPITGKAKAIFVVRALSNLLTPEFFYPIMTVSLRQNGAFIGNLGYRAISVPGDGQIYIFPFDPVLLTDPTGTNVEIKIEFTAGDSGAQFGSMESARLYYDISTEPYDTGWVDAPLSRINEDARRPTVSFHYFPSTPWPTVPAFSFSVLDDQVEHSPELGNSGDLPIANVNPAVAPGFVEAGVGVAGEAMFLTFGETQLAPISETILFEEEGGGRTIGGQAYGMGLFRRRAIPNVTFTVTESEKNDFMERIAWVMGKTGAFYLAANPDEALIDNIFMSFWSTLTDCSATRLIGSHEGEPMYLLSCGFEEKL